MAATAAGGSLMATNTRRVVIERMTIGAIVRRVDTGLRDDALGRVGALLRIDPVPLRPTLQAGHNQQKTLLSTQTFGSG